MLPYREGQPIPNGYRLEESPRTGLVLGGSLSFSIGYASGVGVALANGLGGGTGWLFLPVAGPWVALAARDNPCNAANGGDGSLGDLSDSSVDADCVGEAIDEAVIVVLAAVDGVLQATGATLVIAGLLSQEKALVRDDVAWSWSLSPTRLDRGGAGLEFRGRF